MPILNFLVLVSNLNWRNYVVKIIRSMSAEFRVTAATESAPLDQDFDVIIMSWADFGPSVFYELKQCNPHASTIIITFADVAEVKREIGNDADLILFKLDASPDVVIDELVKLTAKVHIGEAVRQTPHR